MAVRSEHHLERNPAVLIDTPAFPLLAMAFLLISAALCVAIPSYGTLAWSGCAALLAAFSVIYQCVRFAFTKTFLLAAFSIFFMLSYGLGAAVLAAEPELGHGMLPRDPVTLCYSLAVGSTGWSALYLGYMAALSWRLGKPGGHTHVYSDARCLITGAIACALAVFINLFFFSEFGDKLFAVLGIIPSLFAAAGQIAVCILWKSEWKGGRKAALLLLSIIAGAGLITGQRAGMLLPILQFIVFILLSSVLGGRGLRQPLVSLGIVVMAFVLLFPAFTAFKLAMQAVRSQADGLERVEAVAGSLGQVQAEMDTSTSDGSLTAVPIKIMNRLSHLQYGGQIVTLGVEAWGFAHGESLLDSLRVFIPRAIWRDKPIIGLGEKAYALMGYEGPGSATIPLSADWYLNFSWTGVVVGMHLCGIGLFLLNSMLLTSDPGKLAILSWVSLPLMQSGNGISGVTSIMCIYVPFFIIICAFLRDREKAPAPAGE